jgi:hypothetical protein
MIVDLHSEAGLDPGRVGAKAAWLAMGGRIGLPILPGLVVEAAESRGHMRLAARTLLERGSGGARLALTAEPLAIAEELVAAGSRLGENLVARSSTGLEGSGEWSGTFASYLELTPGDLPKAVVGCWASAFAVDAVARQEAAGVEPGSFGMAVLVQPALFPAAGGTARIDDEGTVRVTAVKGSPAPLLQGWSTGHDGYNPTAGEWQGDELMELVGEAALDEIAACVRMANDSLGVNHCEWALDGRIWILQLGVSPPAAPASTSPLLAGLLDPRLTRIARLVTRVGGGLGEELILPWALAGLPENTPVVGATSPDPRSRASELRDELVAHVWAMPGPEALAAARACMTAVLGPDPIPALDRISGLPAPDESLALELLALVEQLPSHDETGVPRRGVGRWEPFVAAVVLSAGDHQQGIAASPGVGAGLRCDIAEPGDSELFAPRAVITSPRPIPNLAALLWDAAGLVTATGSPSAHLYESARALGIPAVSGVEVPVGDRIVAIDGNTGLVASLALNGDEDV